MASVRTGVKGAMTWGEGGGEGGKGGGGLDVHKGAMPHSPVLVAMPHSPVLVAMPQGMGR